MRNFKSWLNKKLTTISLALGNVEKSVIGQNIEGIDITTNQERRNTQGTLMDSLKHGEVTQEVKEFRWRIYKILKEIEGYKTDIVGYTEDGLPITKTIKVDKKRSLTKVNVDKFDSYSLEMVVDNSEIVINTNDTIYNDTMKLFDDVKINKNTSGETMSATHGEIKSDEYSMMNKQEVPIKVYREIIPKFELEKYVKKLNIRSINEKDKLLEFYVSLYPDEYNRKTRLFISDIKKAIENPRSSSILEITGVNFITYKTLGVEDFLEYEYKINSFDKIVVFNGHYIIKFIGEVVINGNNILEEHRVNELDIKYKNKEKKKQ